MIRHLLYELQLTVYILKFVLTLGLAVCRWSIHGLQCAEYRKAAEEVQMQPAFVGD